MNKMKSSLQEVFAKNRAEEIGYDVWDHFVIPPFFDALDLYTARKPRVIIGGRGCGKTMLLRYLSHQSTFSKKRTHIPSEAIMHIGLYWKAETQFCSVMTNRGEFEDTWQNAFNHYAAFILGQEVLSSVKSIAESAYTDKNKIQTDKLDFGRLRKFDSTIPASFNELWDNLKGRELEFVGWLNNVRKKQPPYFLPGKDFVKTLIDLIKEQIDPLSQAIFFVYLDEYENLIDYQQRIINTWLKHSEVPLIFNLAMKRNSFTNKNTLGNEYLANIHDFRTHDLDEYLFNYNFPVFAGEILFLYLSFLEKGIEAPISVAELRDGEALAKRKTETYRNTVTSAILKYLPDVPQSELARQVFNDPSLLLKLREHIQRALKYRTSNIEADQFIQKDIPEASIIAPALLYREKLRPEDILNEMERMKEGRETRFKKPTDWIHNNFIGCFLQLYAPNARICPFYAGFQTFCLLSRGNIRYFLELCHKSFVHSLSDKEDEILTPVPILNQAEAARQTSSAFLGEIRSYGRSGNRLYMFVLRLGSLFSLAAQRSAQSETEQNHFSITKGSKDLNQQTIDFLLEATKWSVLIENRETKTKDSLQPENIEYILNPIYAPYFYISYRKKRRLELSLEEVTCLISGSTDDFKKMMKEYATQWLINEEDLTLPILTLFKL